MEQRIGFLGLGIMGAAMAANIAKAGYPLTVYNRSLQKAEGLKHLGVSIAPNPRALVEACDVAILMVTGPQAIVDLLWGADGCASALDAQKILINMSSVSPSFTEKLYRKLASSGVQFIDAPVSGSKKPAEDATLLILAGGSKPLVDRMTPLLNTMGKKVVYCGEVGKGSMMKMAVNLLLGVMMEGFSEVVNFGRVGGLSFETILDVILSGPLGCALYQMKAGMLRDGEFPVNFPLKHMAKDLKFVVDTAYETGAVVPSALSTLQVYRAGVGKQWGDEDFAAVYKVLESGNDAREGGTDLGANPLEHVD